MELTQEAKDRRAARERMYRVADEYEKANTYKVEALRDAFRKGWDDCARSKGELYHTTPRDSRLYKSAYGKGWNARQRLRGQGL